jgi:nucleoside-diphosphate-sugar epimerase
MRILYIGGTGQISWDCVHESVRQGHAVSVFNRGHHNAGLPETVACISGDRFDDAAYSALAERDFDVVCQFRTFVPAEMRRDIEVFAGHTGQFVFISSASAYHKPPLQAVITEAVPLHNPYSAYSAAKAACEAVLREQERLPYTIVRPSHTCRSKPTTAMGEGGLALQRMLAGKPVVVPGDGTALWTVTHASDFAPPFVRLLGCPRALGQAFHLTGPWAYRWDAIYAAFGAAVGAGTPHIVHVPTDTLLRYNPAWEAALLGDKAWTTQFDNSAIKAVAGDFTCRVDLDALARRVTAAWRAEGGESVPPDPALDALFDRIAAEQSDLGR